MSAMCEQRGHKGHDKDSMQISGFLVIVQLDAQIIFNAFIYL